MVQIGELNTAINTFNVSDAIQWAGACTVIYVYFFTATFSRKGKGKH